MWTAFLLALAFTLCLVGSWLSYGEQRDRRWTPGLMALIACWCGFLWGYVIRGKTTEEIYVVSLVYDSLVLVAYTAFPLALFGVRPTAGVLVGAGLVVSGLVVVKVWG